MDFRRILQNLPPLEHWEIDYDLLVVNHKETGFEAFDIEHLTDPAGILFELLRMTEKSWVKHEELLEISHVFQMFFWSWQAQQRREVQKDA